MLLYYLSLVAGVVAFAFVVLSLASGLLYVSELIEEHSRLAKAFGQRAIYVVLILHGILYFSDHLPFWNLLFSAFCHVVYLQNFSPTWPLISLTSFNFIASSILVIADHFLWFFHFARVTAASRRQHSYYPSHKPPSNPGFAEIATFFSVCVWLAPLFLFLSLSANDNALPLSGQDASHGKGESKSRVSLFRSMFSVPRLRSSRRGSGGIIAPSTPTTPRSDTMMSASLNDILRSESPIPPPPRSPGGSLRSAHGPELSHRSSFELGQPPKRSYQNLGVSEPQTVLRRPSSFHSSDR